MDKSTIFRIFRHVRVYLPTIAFLFGFTWDSFTLQIDSVFDNFLLMIYVIALGILLLIHQSRAEYPYREWSPAIQQFLIGGLFSAYVIYYLKSASTMMSWVFVGILAGVMILNERMDWSLNRPLQLALYFFILWSFFLFFIPVNFKIIGHIVFFMSSVLAVGISFSALLFLHRQRVFNSRGELSVSVGVILGLVGVLYLSYLKNWIPPVPISVKASGTYSNIQRNENMFEAFHSKPGWFSIRKTDQKVFFLEDNSAVYCIASIFAPEGLTFQVIHNWQFFNEGRDEWVQSDSVQMTITGGRDNGYRGYSLKEKLRVGEWRVVVTTLEGSVLKRIPFKIKPGKNPSPTVMMVNEYS
jgi:hypothetical protein